MSTAIKSKDRDVILQALTAGVVPRLGLRHIQVGRAPEVGALVKDIDRITDNGSAIRFIIGEYGAGKTFFLHLTRLIAMEKKCVTMHADLAPDRRIHATGGQARGLYAEAIRNMATRTKPDGGALASIVERFITDCIKEAGQRGITADAVTEQRLASLQDQASGYDYVAVLSAYRKGSEEDNEALKAAALRWLRGEFPTKTDARNALGVRNIIDDHEVYDAFKALGAFIKLAGYAGTLIMFDEMVNLYKLQSSQARNQNYEQILRIVNDTLQGNVQNLGFVFGGTPEFLMDTRRGLYSYQALQSRLAENAFAKNGLVDLSGPVVRLPSLTPEDLLVLLSNIRSVFAHGDPAKNLVPDEALPMFMDHCNKRIGDAYFRTPRNTIKAFIHFLNVLEQNPATNWKELLGNVDVAVDTEGTDETEIVDAPEAVVAQPANAAPTQPVQDGNDELTTLRL
ncbi:MAG: ATP-binding protein [Ferrovibrio sp.]|uniref:ATP-binding protein n=1 Tax=Ferrovibrio sp. TaxID=1917215 RepID=UPI002618450D|nr:ATP-binding protein [Ferrovibrio sp.]MCW0234267.1 ATP-binding protein [Ferrovibrio sp.]